MTILGHKRGNGGHHVRAIGVEREKQNPLKSSPLRLAEECATVALAQLDAENHYRLRAAHGRPEVGLALLDKLDRSLRRRPARKKATG